MESHKATELKDFQMELNSEETSEMDSNTVKESIVGPMAIDNMKENSEMVI